MATIKLQNGKVILKNGAVSCECCEIICEKPQDQLVLYNTFQITKDEYNYYLGGGNLSLNYNISHQESYLVDPSGEPEPFNISGEFSFQTSGSINPESGTEKNCDHVYTAQIETPASYRETYITQDVNYENLGGNVGIEFEFQPKLFVENGNYFVNYLYRIYLYVTASEQNMEDIAYTDSFFTQFPQDDPLITGYISGLSLTVDGNLLETPKIYRGPGGLGSIYIPNNFFVFADGYTNSSSISFDIILEDL